MTIFKGEMPPNGIVGQELRPVTVTTYKLDPPLVWAALAEFADSADNLTIGTEAKFLKEPHLLFTLQQFYGLMLSKESEAILASLG